MPHGVRLRIAVQQQQWWSGATSPQPDDAAGNLHELQLETWEKQTRLFV
jgi:hypothetical protein